MRKIIWRGWGLGEIRKCAWTLLKKGNMSNIVLRQQIPLYLTHTMSLYSTTTENESSHFFFFLIIIKLLSNKFENSITGLWLYYLQQKETVLIKITKVKEIRKHSVCMGSRVEIKKRHQLKTSCLPSCPKSVTFYSSFMDFRFRGTQLQKKCMGNKIKDYNKLS